jgi:Fur family transcriptional regulator, ferric uptake regulator
MSPTSADEIYDVVRSAGGRVTVPLRALVGVLVRDDAHLTADELIAAVDERTPGIAPSTTYRLLQRLEELGVVEHVHTGRSAAFYHLRRNGHAHLICHSCGTVTDIPETMFDALSRSVGRSYHFTIDPRHAALLGRCERCSQ